MGSRRRGREEPRVKKKKSFQKSFESGVEVGKNGTTLSRQSSEIEKKNSKLPPFLSPSHFVKKNPRAPCTRSSPLLILCARRRSPAARPRAGGAATTATNSASRCGRNLPRARSTLSPPSRAGSACWPTLGELDGLWNFHLERCECATVSARNERRELPFGILMRSRRFFFFFLHLEKLD